MDFSIEQSCPSCGANIVLHEDDRLVTCEFCGVANYRLGSRAVRYLLPWHLPDDVDEDQLLFIPYLRFKGAVYYVEQNGVRYKIVDATRIAIDAPQMPASLGLRPQALKVRPVTGATRGRFVKRSVPVKSAFVQAANIIEMYSRKDSVPLLHRAFIGETISLIYQPVYVRDEVLIDAVDKKALGPAKKLLGEGGTYLSSQKSWEPKFTGTLCPGCGGLLEGARDSCVLICENCNIHYSERKGSFQKTPWSVVECDERNAEYFPFWRLVITTTGVEMADFGSLVDFTNQPIIVNAELKGRPLIFYVPAFKINPKTFLRIASQLTMAQAKLKKITQEGRCAGHPVNLEKNEAVEAVKSVIANLTVGKKKSLRLLPEIKVGVESCELAFIPFRKNVHDYIQVHTPATLQVAAVHYGRKL